MLSRGVMKITIQDMLGTAGGGLLLELVYTDTTDETKVKMIDGFSSIGRKLITECRVGGTYFVQTDLYENWLEIFEVKNPNDNIVSQPDIDTQELNPGEWYFETNKSSVLFQTTEEQWDTLLNYPEAVLLFTVNGEPLDFFNSFDGEREGITPADAVESLNSDGEVKRIGKVTGMSLAEVNNLPSWVGGDHYWPLRDRSKHTWYKVDIDIELCPGLENFLKEMKEDYKENYAEKAL